MAKHPEDDARKELERLVRELNRAWREGRFDDLGRAFHPDVVIAGPDLRPLAEGRAACVQSFKDYTSQAVTHAFSESDHEVRTFGDAAVVVYSFEVRYTLAGRTYHERGRDSFVFVKGHEGWQAVWRTVGPSSAAP